MRALALGGGGGGCYEVEGTTIHSREGPSNSLQLGLDGCTMLRNSKGFNPFCAGPQFGRAPGSWGAC